MDIGFLLYPEVTALDAIGPYEVMARVPGARVQFVAERAGPVAGQHGVVIAAHRSFMDCPPLDVLCVPGGHGQTALMEDGLTLAFLRQQAEHARWVTAVCTGSLLLGAAGLLRGYRATTHWRYMDCLRDLGAVPVRKRIVSDRNRVTGAGVSAGIDLGLFLAALVAGEQVAQSIQLQLEYDPQPPFQVGSPDRADEALLEEVEERTAVLHAARREQCRRVGHHLGTVGV